MRENATKRMSRQQLYDLVWSEPMTSVASSLDVPESRGRENDAVIWSPRPDHGEMALYIRANGNSATAERSWMTDTAGKLESKLTKIAIEIGVAAEIQYRERSIRNFEWRVTRKAQLEEAVLQQKREQEKAGTEQRKLIEQSRVDRLLRDAIALQQARNIRNYVQTMRHVKPADRSVRLMIWIDGVIGLSPRPIESIRRTEMHFLHGWTAN